MRFFVAITDRDWFEHLSRAESLDEVNFWQPSGNVAFRALQAGEPFLFKLHSPDDYIVGGGFFSHSTILPASFAWQTFGAKNGAATEQEMRARIERYRKVGPSLTADYDIGCILLQSPFFFSRADWVPVPEWPRNIVRGKGYDAESDGKALWDKVGPLLSAVAMSPTARPPAPGDDAVPPARFGEPQVILPRLGQASFRVIVTDSYGRRCAFTGSPVLHVLDAAHIQPYALGGTHLPSNGILLRQDVHTLFDKGYVTVTPDYRAEVSKRIREEFENGKEYYAIHGKTINLPESTRLRPSPEVLRWHNDNVYRA